MPASDPSPIGLAALPGSESDPGAGPASAALLAALFDDAGLLTLPALPSDPALPSGREAADPGTADERIAADLAARVTAAVAAHRDLLDDPAGELLAGPLLVPAELADMVSGALRPGDHGLRLLLVPDPPGARSAADPLTALRLARNLFLDDDRPELVGVQVPVPPGAPAGNATRAVVDALDFTVPAWLEVDLRPGWPQALAVLAEDGSEGLALTAAGPRLLADADLAALLRAGVDHELTLRAVGGPLPLVRRDDGAHGVLNLVCAVRAALNGAEVDELAEILAASDAAPLTSAVRRMSDADAAVVRAFLAAVPVAPVAQALADLDALGLLPADPG